MVLPNRPSGLPEKERTCYAGYSVVKVLGNHNWLPSKIGQNCLKDFLDFIKSQYGDLTITEDMREWLKIVFENSSENKIYVYILPLEAHGIVVNHIILHIDYGGPEQEMYSRDIYQHICEAIQLTDESDGIVNYAADVNELKVSENKVYSETGKDLERMKRQNR